MAQFAKQFILSLLIGIYYILMQIFYKIIDMDRGIFEGFDDNSTGTGSTGSTGNTTTGTTTTTPDTMEGLLNLNSQTQQLFQNYIDSEHNNIVAEKIHIGSKKTLHKDSLSSVQGWGTHNQVITPPWGTTDDWEILVSPRTNYGKEEDQYYESNNALLKFECFATVNSDKRGWTLTGRYKFKNKNGDGDWNTDTKTNYLLVSKNTA